MSKSKKLVFFGTEEFSVPSFERLIADGWNIAALVTKPDAPAGRGRQIKSPDVVKVAKNAGIEVMQPKKLTDIKEKLGKIHPDAGILVSYGKIIPQEILDIFSGGIINVHPSLLPRYRGASPIETAILNGDKETGVSLMRLSEKMDEGPIYAQERVGISDSSDTPKLTSLLAKAGSDLLSERLDSILEGWLTPKPQSEAEASYSKLLKKEDGVMEFTKPAEQLEREVRAYLTWPRSSANINGQDVIVTKARVTKDDNDGQLVMKCKPGYLDILELVAPSGKTMTGADFLRGYQKE